MNFEYYGFLTDKEKAEVKEHRFTDYTKVNPVTRQNISEFLLKEFDLRHPVTIPCPSEKQLEYLSKQIANLNGEGGTVYRCSAGLIEQGLGKTKSAIMWAAWLYQHGYIDKVVILSPNDLKYQWVEEQLKIHCPNEYTAHVWELMTTKREQTAFDNMLKFPGLKFFSVNIEAMSHLSILPYMRSFCQCGEKEVLVIIDESTTIKNGTRRPVKSTSKRHGSKRANKVLDGFENRPYKMILTGTATPNTPFDLWSQYEFLQKNYFGLGLHDFKLRYGEMVHVSPSPGRAKHFELLSPKLFSIVKSKLAYYGIGEREKPSDCFNPFCVECGRTDCKIKNLTLDIAGSIGVECGLTESAVQRISEMKELVQYKNLDELKEKLTPVTFFCKTEECEDLPEKVFRRLYCSMTGEQARVYKSMMTEMSVVFEGETLSTLYKQVMYMRCQQIAGGLYPYPVDLCKKMIVDGEETEVIKTEYRYKRFEKNPKLETLLEDIETIDKPIIFWARFIEEQRLIYEALCKIYGESVVGWYHGNKKHETETGFKSGKLRFFVGAKSAARGLNLQISGYQYFYSNDFEADTRDQKIKRSHRMGRVGPCIFTDMIMKGSRDKTILDVHSRKMDLIEFFREG